MSALHRKVVTPRAPQQGAAALRSAGASWLRGTAASMTMFPVVEILHHMLLYKARGRPGRWLVPERAEAAHEALRP